MMMRNGKMCRHDNWFNINILHLRLMKFRTKRLSASVFCLQTVQYVIAYGVNNGWGNFYNNIYNFHSRQIHIETAILCYQNDQRCSKLTYTYWLSTLHFVSWKLFNDWLNSSFSKNRNQFQFVARNLWHVSDVYTQI